MYNWMQKQFNKHRRKMQTGEGGFTLVELVVVIAIMGILAGGGYAGYSGYVKNAAKKADLTTVSNIMRAAELGQYAFDYSLPTQLKGSGAKLPVGFVMLSADQDVEVLQTNANANTHEGTTCTFKNFEHKVFKNLNTVGTVSKTKSGLYGITQTCTIYDESAFTGDKAVYDESDKYCEHSNLNEVTIYVGDLAVARTKSDYDSLNTYKYEGCTEITVYILDSSRIYDESSKHKDGQKLTGVSYDTSASAFATEGVVSDVMRAAYGDEYTKIRLQSNAWGAADIASGMASVYQNKDSIIGLIDQLAGVFGFLIGDDDKLEYIGDFATNIVSRTNAKDTFLSQWDALENEENPESSNLWKGHPFGFTQADETNKLNRTGTTTAYNSSFTSYLKMNSKGTHSTVTACNDGIITREYSGLDGHIDCILNWGDKTAPTRNESSNRGGTINDPYTLCMSAFLNPNSTLPIKNCEECKEWYEKYISNGASTQNAKAVYDTLVMVDSTVEDVLSDADSGMYQEYRDSGYLKYYETYLEGLKKVYSAAKSKADSKDNCIVITIIQSSDGSIDFEIAPKEADPRNN